MGPAIRNVFMYCPSLVNYRDVVYCQFIIMKQEQNDQYFKNMLKTILMRNWEKFKVIKVQCVLEILHIFYLNLPG